MKADDTVQFFRAWLADPLRVAAVAPSGPALTRLMVTDIGPSSGQIMELGPGTGAFTRAMLDRGVQPEQLTLVESGPEFVRMLSVRYPDIRILAMDAADLRRVRMLESAKARAVVSGLPLLSMPQRKVYAVLSGALLNMTADASFYQFTYGLRCPVPRPILERLGLSAVRTGFTPVNMPPASVYRFQRRIAPSMPDSGNSQPCSRQAALEL